MLQACVWAMADEFADQSFLDIPAKRVKPAVLHFFCSAARHWWARLSQGEEMTEASYTSHAIDCPFGEAEIIALILVFERHVASIWNPGEAKLALKRRAS
jgi:hypothetical protein